MPDKKALMAAEFLVIRAKILELAAAFDRFERAEGDLSDDPRPAQIEQAIRVLNSDQPNRAEQVQLIFSREYDPAWRDKMPLGR